MVQFTIQFKPEVQVDQVNYDKDEDEIKVLVFDVLPE